MKWVIRETSGKKWVIDNDTYIDITNKINNGLQTISFTLNDGSIKIIKITDIDGIWKGEKNEQK